MKILDLGCSYSLLIRVEFQVKNKHTKIFDNLSGVYRMAGHQIGFRLDKDNYKDQLNSIHEKVVARIHRFLVYYNLDFLDSIQILIVPLELFPDNLSI